MKLPYYGILALMALAIAQIVYYYPLLPETVASHFDAIGRANGTSSKPMYFAVYAIAIGIAVAIGLGLPRLFDLIPPSLMNLPHKEYWLSDENRFSTIAYFKQSFAWLGMATLLLIIFAFQLTFQVNLNPASGFPILWMYLGLGAYLISVLGWVVALFLRFGKIPT